MSRCRHFFLSPCSRFTQPPNLSPPRRLSIYSDHLIAHQSSFEMCYDVFFNQTSGRKRMLRLTLILVIAVAAIVPCTRAESATLAGIARDSITLDPLVGANILFVGTTQGVTTSFDG